MPYFFLAPKALDADKAYFDGVDYPTLFATLSDKAVFDTIVFLNKRSIVSKFTLDYVAKNMNFTDEEAKRVFELLKKLNIVGTVEVTLDDTTSEVLCFASDSSSSFVAMLTFARDLLNPPNHWYWYNGVGGFRPHLAELPENN